MTEVQLITVELNEYRSLQQFQQKCQQLEQQNRFLKGTIKSHTQDYSYELRNAKEQIQELTVKLKELSKNGLKMAKELIRMQEALWFNQQENHSRKKQSQEYAYKLIYDKEFQFRVERQELQSKIACLEVEILDAKKTAQITIAQKEIDFNEQHQEIIKKSQFLKKKIQELKYTTIELKNQQLKQFQSISQLEEHVAIFRKRISQLQGELEMKQKELKQKETQMNTQFLFDSFNNEKQNYEHTISALKEDCHKYKQYNQELIAQNDKLKIKLIELQDNQGLIITYQRELKQIRERYQKSQQQLKRASEELTSYKQQNMVMLSDYDSFFTSHYFMKEMQIREHAIKACQTIVKLHLLYVKNIIRYLKTEDEKIEIYSHEKSQFADLLTKRLKDKQFLEMI